MLMFQFLNLSLHLLHAKPLIFYPNISPILYPNITPQIRHIAIVKITIVIVRRLIIIITNSPT